LILTLVLVDKGILYESARALSATTNVERKDVEIIKEHKQMVALSWIGPALAESQMVVSYS